MKHVEIRVSTAAVWSRDWKDGKIFAFARAGDCFCEVLNALRSDFGRRSCWGDEGDGGGCRIEKEEKKSLKLVIEPGWGESHLLEKRWRDDDDDDDDGRSLLQFKWGKVLDRAVEEILKLIEGVRTVRRVEVVNRGFFDAKTKPASSSSSSSSSEEEEEKRKKTRWEYVDEAWRRRRIVVVEGDD